MKKVRSKLHPTEIGTIKTFSLSPNDEIGEIAVECTGCTYYYNNLTELCEKWEDVEEPKEWWYIDVHGPHKVVNNDEYYQQVKAASKEIGNCFETREEAERAVKKLEAWKRLKDNGFVFCGKGDCLDTIKFDYGPVGYNNQDFNLLFGGEE